MIGSLCSRRICDQGSLLVCDRWAWLVGGSIIGTLWNDWMTSVVICLRVVVHRIGTRRWKIVDRNLLYFLAEADGN